MLRLGRLRSPSGLGLIPVLLTAPLAGFRGIISVAEADRNVNGGDRSRGTKYE